MPVGKIHKFSNSHFTWILSFSYFRERSTGPQISPDFQCMGDTCYILANMILKENEIRFFMKRRFCRKVFCQKQTYRMFIKDGKDVTYWTSHKFLHGSSDVATYDPTLNFQKFDLEKYKRAVAPSDVFYLHLTFGSSGKEPEPPREDRIFCKETPILRPSFFARFAAVGSNSQPEPSDNIDDVIWIKDTSISHPAAIGSNLQPEPSGSFEFDGVDKLLKDFKDLCLNGHKSDVTLNVKGEVFKAHKAILSARSPVFEKMFNHDMLEENSGSVKITDCEPGDFQAFLLYLYTGKVENPTVECVAGLYGLADKYNVEQLVPQCVRFLISSLSVVSFCVIVSLGLRHCETELLDSANTFFSRNMKEIVGTDEWMNFNKENPVEAMEILREGFSKVH